MVFQFLREWLKHHPKIRDPPQQKMLKNNYDSDANKGKSEGYLYLENNFGFCKRFKKVTKNLSFHLMLKTDYSQDITYTSI